MRILARMRAAVDTLLPLAAALLVAAAGCSTTRSGAERGPDETVAKSSVTDKAEAEGETAAPAAAAPAAPAAPVDHFTRGLELADRGDLRGAIAALEKATEAEPERLDVWRARVNLLDVAGRRQEAARAAWRLVELSREDWQSWTTLASVLEAGASWDAAIGAHKMAASLAKAEDQLANTVFDVINVGNGAMAIGAYDAAARAFGFAGAVAGDTPLIRYHQTRLVAARGRRADARKLAKQTLKEIRDRDVLLPGKDEIVAQLERMAKTGKTEQVALARSYHPLPVRFSTHDPASETALAIPIDPVSERGYPLWNGNLLRVTVPATDIEQALPTERSFTVRYTPDSDFRAETVLTVLAANKKSNAKGDLEAWRDSVRDPKTPPVEVQEVAPGAYVAVARDKNARPGTSDFVYLLRFAGTLQGHIVNLSSQARGVDKRTLERFFKLGLSVQVMQLGANPAPANASGSRR